MKKSIFTALMLTLLSAAAFAQETAEHTGPVATMAESPNFMAVNYWWQMNPLSLTDGTQLWWTDAKPMLAAIPANETLLREMNNWRVVNWTSAAIGFTLWMGGAMYYNWHDMWPNAEIVVPTLILTGLAAYMMEIISYDTINKKLARAVNNYNLSIMGFSIPVK
jgi:hypothetical protein